jgi:hypothetical protein
MSVVGYGITLLAAWLMSDFHTPKIRPPRFVRWIMDELL